MHDGSAFVRVPEVTLASGLFVPSFWVGKYRSSDALGQSELRRSDASVRRGRREIDNRAPGQLVRHVRSGSPARSWLIRYYALVAPLMASKT